MRKTDKLIDKKLRVALTEVCESLLTTDCGFKWLTHTAKYTNFPQSLKITIVFDTNEELESFLTEENVNAIYRSITQALEKVELKIPSLPKHVLFDTEEKRAQQN